MQCHRRWGGEVCSAVRVLEHHMGVDRGGLRGLSRTMPLSWALRDSEGADAAGLPLWAVGTATVGLLFL